jgi:hypothetical protein
MRKVHSYSSANICAICGRFRSCPQITQICADGKIRRSVGQSGWAELWCISENTFWRTKVADCVRCLWRAARWMPRSGGDREGQNGGVFCPFFPPGAGPIGEPFCMVCRAGAQRLRVALNKEGCQVVKTWRVVKELRCTSVPYRIRQPISSGIFGPRKILASALEGSRGGDVGVEPR